ncbi:MAG: PLP-dependent lyase/thiolase [Candidatus Magasanikbacteria bacterium]|nr:PLP-dependent lyase/thiolase [Candidatus Magasanikbacteria bacterium]
MITPLINADRLANNLEIPLLYIKREDLHPYGSHKGRSLPLMIEKYVAEGWQNFVISSSGNAALAAALFIKEYNIKNHHKKLHLKIYTGYKIDKTKFAHLLQITYLPLGQKIKNFFFQIKPEIKIRQTLNPKQSAFLAEKNSKTKNLRQSIDDTALLGYTQLAKELSQLPNLSAVFIPTSSGTTAQGLYQGFEKLNLKPEIYIIQTPTCHPFIQNDLTEKDSLAKAIVDKVGRRKKEITNILSLTNGEGLIVNNQELISAEKIYKTFYPADKISYNSLLSLAGLIQKINTGKKFSGPVVCLFTGK